ncbi:hypothetical protein [uncultured Brevundimonas sp.]|uniref:hypothetical protein n=1 Tax=uncultured Brevundimonas sp. TaxID=213418 RepID=UPI0025E21D74|nr:hypothetical protein [uncultured Brevundimonas sp.]
MNAGLNLLTALFLLAPGFGVFAGVYYTGLRKPFRPAPAAPGSLLALALVAIGALAAHGMSSIPYAVQEGWCGAHECFDVAFQPNPYITLIDPAAVTAAPGISLTIALIHLVVTALLGLALGRTGMWLLSKSTRFQSHFYGWTNELIERAPTRYHVINAFAVTDISNEGLSLGYEGTLLDFRQDPSGKFTSASLRDVQAFVIAVSADKVVRTRSPRRDPIPFMMLESENVKNVAFALYFDAKAAAAVTNAEIAKMSKAEQVALVVALTEAKASERRPAREAAEEPLKSSADALIGPVAAPTGEADTKAGQAADRAAASAPTAGTLGGDTVGSHTPSDVTATALPPNVPGNTETSKPGRASRKPRTPKVAR